MLLLTINKISNNKKIKYTNGKTRGAQICVQKVGMIPIAIAIAILKPKRNSGEEVI